MPSGNEAGKEGWNIVLEIFSDDPNYVLGWEAGQVYEVLKQRPETLQRTVHSLNDEQLRHIAQRAGYTVEFCSLGEGWADAHFTRNNP